MVGWFFTRTICIISAARRCFSSMQDMHVLKFGLNSEAGRNSLQLVQRLLDLDGVLFAFELDGFSAICRTDFGRASPLEFGVEESSGGDRGVLEA